MSQDTTLPPLPEQERAEFEAWAKRRCFDLTILEDDESDEYKELETESAWEAWQARAAIAAQAQPQEAPADWLHLKHYGYAPGNYMSRCSDCGQTPAMDKRATRCRPCAEAAFGKAQQAQVVPAWQKPAERLVTWLHCMSYNESYFGEPSGSLKQTVNELRHLLPRTGLLAAAPQAEPQTPALAPGLEVSVGRMTESNGRVTWIVNLYREGDQTLLNGHQVYSSHIEGRAQYEAAALRHFLGQGPEPDVLDFDTDGSAQSPAAGAEPQPEREPIPAMTWDQFKAASRVEFSEYGEDDTMDTATPDEIETAVRIVRLVERHHGIGTKGGGTK